jgi:heme/copper-type cytochrome/quinol oxidase subunit 1
MTTIDTHPDTAAEAVARTSGAAGSVGAWIASTDHKRIGRMYIGAGLLGLLGSLVIGLLLAFERIDAEGYALLEDGAIVQMVSAQRVGLLFGAVVPLMLGLAVAVLPLQLGARALALPRLAAAGFWGWLSGLVLVMWSIAANGGPGGGDAQMVDLFLAAMIVLALGALMTAISLFTTLITHRAPGMRLDRAPLLSWSGLLYAVVLLLVVPTIIGTLIYLWVDNRYGRVAFGGNVGILEWIGWAVTLPAATVLALPAFGVLADTAPVAARIRQPKRAGMLVGIGLVSIGALSAVTQVSQNLPWEGDGLEGFGTKLADLLPFLFFNGLPLLGALVVLALALLAQKNGRPRPLSGFVFSFLGIGMILAGMAGHVLFLVDDAGLQGTVFEEGAFIYVVFGAVLAGLGGISHWGPKLWGRSMPEKATLPLAALGFIATVLASLPLYIAGFADQPALVADGFSYSGPQEIWNVLVTAGQGLMLLVVLAFVALALRSFRSGEPAGDDPWGGQTLEWATSSPPPEHNFVEVPVVASAEPLTDLKPSGSDA